jgi:hypothetical protein
MSNEPTIPRRRIAGTAKQVEAVHRNIVAITNNMVNLALEGDIKAAEWVASRAFPKTRLVQFELPAIESAADVVADPVQVGLVSSLNRLGANLTGVNAFSGELGAEGLALLH